MDRLFARPKMLVFVLLFLTAIPIGIGLVRLVQVPLGALPADAQKFSTVPHWLWLHALGGVTFGLVGPLQFMGALRQRFGRLHRVFGRIFALGGGLLGVSGLMVFASVPNSTTLLLDTARVVMGGALLVALGLAIAAVRQGDFATHRAWMIRAYAIGMGSGATALVMFPIFLINGQAPDGLLSDLVVVGSWLVCIGLAETVVRWPGRGLESP